MTYRVSRQLFLISIAVFWCCGVAFSASDVLIQVENGRLETSDTQYVVDVTINAQSTVIKGIELNIGFDSDLLTFSSGETVDGNWYASRIDVISVDDTNEQSGEIKILLASAGTGVSANTASTLARLTFDVKSLPAQPLYSLVFLKSSAGLRDTNNASFKFAAVKGDANEDLEVTAQDAVDAFWLTFQTSWSEVEKFLSDVNSDSEITSQDAVDTFWLSF